MPSFRGIEVAILTQSEAGQLPEYPHPDGSSLQLRDPRNSPRGGKSDLCEVDSEIAANRSPLQDPTVNPMVSVYMPSVPGAQFWIKYVVEYDPSPPAHLLFKLYMNGRQITSWGINPRIKSQGRVEKALYEPSDRWNQEENGVTFKQQGIEARYFYFVGDQQELSVADDGGLIEVQVFRAKGRKRRAAKLDRYRQQDRYGIATPSGGLLDNPQDVTFFDFHLVDPKDAPFATFRFHYRSWENLHQLNLVPEDESGLIEPSIIDTTGHAPEPSSQPSSIGLDQNFIAGQRPSLPVGDPDESIFDDSTSSGDNDTTPEGHSKPRQNCNYVLRTPPQLLPRSSASQNLPQPSKTLRDSLPPGFPESYLQRPLPNRPLPDLPTDGSVDPWVPRSRKSSSASAAPSIAPSLLSYIKNESQMDETVKYGQAQELPMDKEHPGVPLNHKDSERITPPLAHSSPSDYEGSFTPGDDSQENNPALLSPGNYLASTGSMLEKQIGQLEDGQASPCDKTVDSRRNNSPQTKGSSRGSRKLDIDFSKFPHLQLSESEWIHRTSSPQAVPRRMLSPRLGRLWSTLRRNKSRSPLRNLHEEKISRNYSSPHLVGPDVKERHGNCM